MSLDIKSRSSFLFQGISMLFGGFLLGIFCVYKNGFSDLSISTDYNQCILIAITALFTAFGIYLYFMVMQIKGHIQATYIWFFTPIVAIVLSMIFENYTLDVYSLSGMAVLLLGSVIANKNMLVNIKIKIKNYL